MTSNTLDVLAGLIERDREALLSHWRGQVRRLPSARQLDVPTLNDHIPELLSELVTALRAHSEESIAAASEGSPPAHGLQRVKDGFDIGEVVAEYNILRGCLHDLADRNGVSLQGKPFHVINRVLDDTIGMAVQTYATGRALEVQKRREEYLAFVAHDLRTPLSAISLTVGLLELKLSAQSSEENRRMWNVLRRSVKNLADMVRKILDENANLQTKIGVKPECRNFDFWPLVESLVYDLQPMAAAGTRLINQVPDDLVIFADAGLFRRVLQNLMANAIKYTPGGEVVIGARAGGADGAIECWVSDNGAGIAEELRDKVFDKGETDQEKVGGLGLGLAIVKTFTEAHGGTVAVESKVGIGSTFRVSIPGRKSE